MDKEDVIYAYNGILATKKNEIITFAATWVDLEIIILSEVSQKWSKYLSKDKYHTLICGF